MITLEEVKQFLVEHHVAILFSLLFIAIVYTNWKINDVDYRLQQTLVHNLQNPTNMYGLNFKPDRSSLYDISLYQERF